MLRAIYAATILHEGQFRKSGEPYIDHPTRITSSLVARGVTDDITLAAAMLHDVIEDCNITAKTLFAEYGISTDAVTVVKVLTKSGGIDTAAYYNSIGLCPRACVIKIEDRCHNVSTMAKAFTTEKLWKYIHETRDYVIPLCKHARRAYPELSDQVITIKYHIEAVVDAIEFMLQKEVVEVIAPDKSADCTCEHIHRSSYSCPSKAPSMGAIKDSDLPSVPSIPSYPLTIKDVEAAKAFVTEFSERCVIPKNGFCTIPPEGWTCSRECGHEGPCAASPLEKCCISTCCFERSHKGNCSDGKNYVY